MDYDSDCESISEAPRLRWPDAGRLHAFQCVSYHRCETMNLTWRDGCLRPADGAHAVFSWRGHASVEAAYLGHKVLVYWRPSAGLGLLPDDSLGIRLGIMRLRPDGASPGRYVVDHRHDVSLRRSNMLMRYEVLPSLLRDSARQSQIESRHVVDSGG